VTFIFFFFCLDFSSSLLNAHARHQVQQIDVPEGKVSNNVRIENIRLSKCSLMIRLSPTGFDKAEKNTKMKQDGRAENRN